MGRQPLRGGRRIDRGAMHAEAAAALRAPRRATSTRAARRAASRSPTSRSSRSPRRSRSTPACSSWTSRPPRSAASRSSGSSPSPAACATRARAVVFISPPLRRGVRPLRHGHRDARRRVRRARQPIDGDSTVDEIVRPMVGREVGDLFPKTPTEIGDVGARGRAASSPRGVFHDVSLHGPRAARSSRSPASSAPAAARSPGRSSASTATTPARVRCRRRRAAARIAARGHARPGVGVRPRGPPQAGPGHRHARSTATSRWRRCAGCDRPGCSRRAAETRAGRATWASRLAGQDGRARHAGVHDDAAATSRRSCSAKWLATQPEAAHHRRADPRHRRRHQGRGAPPARRAGRPRASAILMISSELPEVLGMADRVLVVREGRLIAELRRAEADAGARHARRHRPGHGGGRVTRTARRPRPGRQPRAGAASIGAPAARSSSSVLPLARDRHRARARRRDRG